MVYEHSVKVLRVFQKITWEFDEGFENPERLQYVTKELYPVIAEKYNTDWRAVEHSIRITISRSWERDSALFAKILGAWGTERPAVGRFLAVLYTYLLIEFEENVI